MDVFGTSFLTVAVFVAVGFPWRTVGRKLGLPPAVSLMALGVLVGPDLLDWVPSPYVSGHAPWISGAAFAILLVRAGLGVVVERRVLLSALVLGLWPVALEFGVLAGGARWLVFDRWDLCWLFAFLLAAVSPAVILPTMLEQKLRGRGARHRVPDRIMGATVINAFVAQTGILALLDHMTPPRPGATVLIPLHWPVAGRLVVGLGIGILLGWLVGALLPLPRVPTGDAEDEKPRRRATLAVALTGVAVYFAGRKLGFESVFATLAVGALVHRRLGLSALHVESGLRRIWSFVEILLFANLGMRISVSHLTDPRLLVFLLLLIAVALAVRIRGAYYVARWGGLPAPESTYVSLAQIPKATIQAVFGALPLHRFLEAEAQELVPAGSTLLVAAVLAIVATAPAGAVVLDRWAKTLMPPRKEGDHP